MRFFDKIATFTVGILLTVVALCGMAGCGGNENCGSLSIEDVTVYIDSAGHYTFAELQPEFSAPDKAEDITYTYDESSIRIENGIVVPIKNVSKTVNVRAESEHYETSFHVEVWAIRLSGSSNPLYDVSAFSSGISKGQEKCAEALTQNTTVFIGDSFMDDGYIGEYMQTFGVGKDLITAGISSTTSFHWEAIYSDIIGETAPKNIVIHVGTNNFYDENCSAEATQTSLKRLFMYLHTSYASSHIYWFNITQRANVAYADMVTQTNAYMAEWCEAYDWVTCVDTCSKVTVDMLGSDGVHPKTESYSVFTDALAEAGCVIETLA